MPRPSRTLVCALIHDEELEICHRRNGKIVIYRDAKEFSSARRQMEKQELFGSRQSALRPSDCVSIEPALAPVADLIVGGIYTPGEEVADCYRFVTELTCKLRQSYGVELRFGVKATGLRTSGSRIAAVMTTVGDLAADTVIVAAGLGSKRLLKSVGLGIAIYPLTGYSLTLPIRPTHVPPQLSITDAHHRIVYASLGNKLRIAGMVDLTAFAAASPSMSSKKTCRCR